MKCADVVVGVEGLGAHDHLCWIYQDAAEFHTTAMRFLGEGLSMGARCLYATSGDMDDLRVDLSHLMGGRREGSLLGVSLLEAYGQSQVLDPVQGVEFFASATNDALAAGFTGLRVAIDASPMVGTPEQLETFARYEHLGDRYTTTHPLSAMCAYDSARLGEETVAAMACLHSLTNVASIPFRLYALDPRRVALAGEIDMGSTDLFAATLERIAVVSNTGELVIHASELDFIDHHGLYVLADHARRRGATVVLDHATEATGRLIEVLELDHVQVRAARA